MKSQKVTKQVVGIDIGMESFYVCYKVQIAATSIIIKGTKSFNNNADGMDAFYLWCEKRNKTPEIKPVFVMEATGIYYENLAYFLYEKDQIVSVQLAQKLKYFAKGCNLKTKTDKVDSKMIAQYGVEKNLIGTDLWTPPSKEFKSIRDLSREHTNTKRLQSRIKSQLHALAHAHLSNEVVVKIKNDQISFYQKQIKEIEKQMQKLIKSDKKLHSKIRKIEKVNGLGFITIIKILTETNGFLLFRNIRQLVSYAGLDVIEKESGKYKGKTKISKKGNAHIRSALYMPALTAMQHNKTLKIFYERVNQGRTIKKQGVIAVMRKLLILIYTLWKKDEEYIEDYQASTTDIGAR
ncbi:MAG: IS110 family transposase [Flavobacteriaceae bacterium]|nr:IS110 family transposase [Flavobacteriaceae bacterium]